VEFDYSRFYTLGEGFMQGAIRVRSLDEIPTPDALTRAEVIPQEPVRFRYDEGRQLYDYIGTTWAVLDIVSDRVVRVLTDSGFTGWTTYPVDVRYKDGQPLHGYRGLAVTGRCGPIEDKLSPVEILPPPVPGGEAMPHYMGLRFRPDTWDGSDVFTPAGTTAAVVTEHVRNALVKAEITNLSLDRLSEVNRFVLDDEE